jgi:hypothetical protein
LPLYFFHSQTDKRFTDTDGAMLASPKEARAVAIETCGQMMQDCPEVFWVSRPWSVTVTDATGLILWEINIDGAASASAPK